METKELICISCPIGCRLTLVKDETSFQGYKVLGNTCKRGVEYAIKEMTAPTRMVTSTVKIKGATLSRLPVRTTVAIPKERIMECMQIINSLCLDSPVDIGQVLVEDLFGTGAQIIASRSL
jgi:CxxC motif-containing protein